MNLWMWKTKPDSKPLDFLAGPAALKHVRKNGLCPEDVAVMAGAAGGPKWLILSQLDRLLFDPARGWLGQRKAPLHLVGASSGAWRFAAAAQRDPLAAIQRFEDAYIHQSYDQKPTPAEVSREGERILAAMMGVAGSKEILDHPLFRLVIVTARCRNTLVASETAFVQGLAMAAAALMNALDRKSLGWFFERVLFHDPRTLPPIDGRLPVGSPDGLPTRMVPLTSRNLPPALMASGSIPLVMSGVWNTPGAPPGVFRDGGVIDYHIDIPLRLTSGIILFPHYSSRVIPGWLDKMLWWRRPQYLDNTLVVAPSMAFLDQLPYRKIPDRSDFQTFFKQDDQRIAYWKTATNMGQRLADDFWEATISGRIRDRIRPYAG